MPSGGASAAPPAGERLEPGRRSYDSPVRRQQAERTRERIVAAGTEMVHGFPSWDWRELTVRAVARRAQVNESTIYRYFGSERGLRDAVMRHLEQEAGVDVDTLRLDAFGDVIGRVYSYLSSFPTSGGPTGDPTFAALDRRRRDALVAAVAAAADDWSPAECELAAAALDVFWSVPSFERLITVWELDTSQASRVAGWVIELIRGAVRDGHGPR
ncbi:TetR/AcrR family transcriptional regulator [Frankia sp. Mgl5]|uniref:TetR/AcrR family transcriptional regulator n=1 Tax=Frankia sp. Mgl5 TaxID=2933793 RepID=UPI00200F5DC8|nr:TetR/AcrR family transcriptional regulator [Frankia sp. Mgl5]MCK9926288.1 TetR/AcrR family transcriptional regulator [Frankia sp. Mgl5]